MNYVEPKLVRNLRHKLDQEWKKYTGLDRRIERRLQFHRALCVRFMQSDGEVLACESHARNLSPTGINLLHHPFAYPDSSVVVSLAPCHGESIHIAGEVRHCKFVGKNFHDSSITFHERIELEDFLFEAELGEAQKLLDQARMRFHDTILKTNRLQGMHAILVEQTPEQSGLLISMFRAEGAVLHEVLFLGDAIDMIRTAKVDLLLCREQHDGADACQIVQLCREQGFNKPIIGLSWWPATLKNARKVSLTGRVDSIDPESQQDIADLLNHLAADHAPQRRAPDTRG